MTQEEKQLLLQDLCARLLYGVKCNVWYGPKSPALNEKDKYTDDILETINPKKGTCTFHNAIGYDFGDFPVEHVKPYLRPMSSMIEEEILELYKIAYDTWYSDSLYYKYEEWITFRDSIQNNALCFENRIWLSDINEVIGWLNAHHFDYHDLIKKGLAITAPKEMYNTKIE